MSRPDAPITLVGAESAGMSPERQESPPASLATRVRNGCNHGVSDPSYHGSDIATLKPNAPRIRAVMIAVLISPPHSTPIAARDGSGCAG